MIYPSVTEKYCQCGCGRLTPLAKWNDKRRGAIKGQPVRYMPTHTGIHKAERRVDFDGYVLILVPGHHRVDCDGRVREHILVAEKTLGRNLKEPECIHHADENKENNSPNNLVICPDQAYHMLLHQRIRAFKESGNADYRKCKVCKTYDDTENMVFRPSDNTYLHKSCWAERAQRERALKKERTLQCCTLL